MIKSKDNKGITLITVIIAVVLMTILVGVGTSAGINMYKQCVMMNGFLIDNAILCDTIKESGGLSC